MYNGLFRNELSYVPESTPHVAALHRRAGGPQSVDCVHCANSANTALPIELIRSALVLA